MVEKCCHFFDLMRLIIKSDPVRIMASAGQEVNHLGETYDGQKSDIWDCGYVIDDFENGARAMLELCMFAEGSEYQEEIHAIGSEGKIACLVPGPARFWPDHLAESPVPKELLTAGDHNGSTFYQHQKFQAAVLGAHPPEVSLRDEIWAVRMGHPAQQSAQKKRIVEPES